MKPITNITGKTIPLAKNDVDTDLIIPAQYLTSVSRKGYGENLFRRLRDSDPDFIFNQEKFSEAKILIAGDNFGCGSSREHAVWALREAGIDAVVAESFADIFKNNSAKNGLVLVELPADVIQQLLKAAESGDYELDINIDTQIIKEQQGQQWTFELDSFHRYCFMQGLEELDYLLQHKDDISAFRAQQEQQQPVPLVE